MIKRDDPFGFDMSVSSAKKKNPRGRRGMTGASETSTRNCEHPGCEEAGKYRAPRAPDVLDEYLWFCKDHVREYNQKWSFFDGTTEAELNAQRSKDRVWERKTKPMSDPEQRAWARLGIEDPHQVLGQNATRNPGKSANGHTRKLPPTERKAIEILAGGGDIDYVGASDVELIGPGEAAGNYRVVGYEGGKEVTAGRK